MLRLRKISRTIFYPRHAYRSLVLKNLNTRGVEVYLKLYNLVIVMLFFVQINNEYKINNEV